MLPIAGCKMKHAGNIVESQNEQEFLTYESFFLP